MPSPGACSRIAPRACGGLGVGGRGGCGASAEDRGGGGVEGNGTERAGRCIPHSDGVVRQWNGILFWNHPSRVLTLTVSPTTSKPESDLQLQPASSPPLLQTSERRADLPALLSRPANLQQLHWSHHHQDNSAPRHHPPIHHPPCSVPPSSAPRVSLPRHPHDRPNLRSEEHSEAPSSNPEYPSHQPYLSRQGEAMRPAQGLRKRKSRGGSWIC